ncbi:MAG: PHB depolymerase family esterase, partial [Flavobacteriaceae bacterium]|nr:PHB depolymerase family esterase [Flavobacteriaceae bacterium]
MKLINPLLALLITIGINYQSFGQAGVTSTNKLEHDEIMREYILHIPTNYNEQETYPLLLNFHGYGSNATQHMQYSRFNDLADRENFIVVYPEGTMLEDKTHWNVGGWTLASKVDDVSFVNALIDKLASDYKVDKSRIYATGMSNGGYMSFLLACQLSDKIAAIASVTGSMTP